MDHCINRDGYDRFNFVVPASKSFLVALPGLAFSLVKSILRWLSPPLLSVVYLGVGPIVKVRSMVHLSVSTRVKVDEGLGDSFLPQEDSSR